MPVKLLKTKWYIVDLNTKCVAIDYVYDRFWQAVETERERNRMKRFTAMRGSYILIHAGKPWIIPLTPEEAEDEYMSTLTASTGNDNKSSKSSIEKRRER